MTSNYEALDYWHHRYNQYYSGSQMFSVFSAFILNIPDKANKKVYAAS